MAALRRAFPQAEWDALTTTIDAQIAEEDKQNPAQWLIKLSEHYLGGEPIMQSTHHFLGILKQELGMSIQAWHTLVRVEYKKCKLSEPFSINLNPDVKPIQVPPNRYAAPKLSIIKGALDKLIQTGQLVRVNEPTAWISNMVVRERPASATSY